MGKQNKLRRKKRKGGNTAAGSGIQKHGAASLPKRLSLVRMRLKRMSLKRMSRRSLGVLIGAAACVIAAITVAVLYSNGAFEKKEDFSHRILAPLKEPGPSRFQDIDGVLVNPGAAQEGAAQEGAAQEGAAQEGAAQEGAAQANTATLMFTGDLMCVSEMQRRAMRDGTYDFNAGFDYVKPILEQADLTVGNLETVLSHSAPYKHEAVRIMGARSMQHNCNAPSTFLDAVRHAGFDAVVTAHNHSLDAGILGIKETLGYLSDYNIHNTGSFMHKDDRRFLLFDVNGIKLAILAYATSFNTFDELYTVKELELYVNGFTQEKAQRDIAAARGAGAEYVFVYMHWGSQNSTEVTQKQLDYGQQLADAGADFILGNHPHVLNRFDYIVSADGRSVPVIYSLGNFFTDMNEVEFLNSDSIILQVTLEKSSSGVSVADLGYIPCFIMIDYNGLRNQTLPCFGETGDKRVDLQLDMARRRIAAALGGLISEIEF